MQDDVAGADVFAGQAGAILGDAIVDFDVHGWAPKNRLWILWRGYTGSAFLFFHCVNHVVAGFFSRAGTFCPGRCRAWGKLSCS